MVDDGFRLPEASYDQLAKMIAVYGRFKQSVPQSEIAGILGIHQTTVSRNGAFFLAVGILQGTRSKELTSAGRALSSAIEHELPDEIQRTWLNVVDSNEFINKVLAAVKIRKGMDRSALQAHIAYTAGQSKTSVVMSGANALIDILTIATLLKEDNGRLTVNSDRDLVSRGDVEGDAPKTDQSLDANTSPKTDSLTPLADSHHIISSAQGPIGVSIQIQLQCSIAELEGLGSRLRDFVRELSDTNQLKAETVSGNEDPVTFSTN